MLLGALGAGARRLLPRRAPLGVGGLLRGGRGIRAAGSLREVLSEVALVDHHAHGILRAPPATPRRVPRPLLREPRTRASGRTSRRASPTGARSRALAALFGCEPTEDAVFAHRLRHATRRVRGDAPARHRHRVLLVDDGFPPPGGARTGAGWASSPAASRRRSCASSAWGRRIARVGLAGRASTSRRARGATASRGSRRSPPTAPASTRRARRRERSARSAALEANAGDRRSAARAGPLRLRRRRPLPPARRPDAPRAARRALPRHAVRAAALLPVRARGGLAGTRLRQRLLRPLADDPARLARGRDGPRGARARAGLEAPLRVGRRTDARAVLPRRDRVAGRAGRGARARPSSRPRPSAAARAVLRGNALALYGLDDES